MPSLALFRAGAWWFGTDSVSSRAISRGRVKLNSDRPNIESTNDVGKRLLAAERIERDEMNKPAVKAPIKFGHSRHLFFKAHSRFVRISLRHIHHVVDKQVYARILGLEPLGYSQIATCHDRKKIGITCEAGPRQISRRKLRGRRDRT